MSVPMTLTSNALLSPSASMSATSSAALIGSSGGRSPSSAPSRIPPPSVSGLVGFVLYPLVSSPSTRPSASVSARSGSVKLSSMGSVRPSMSVSATVGFVPTAGSSAPGQASLSASAQLRPVRVQVFDDVRQTVSVRVGQVGKDERVVRRIDHVRGVSPYRPEARGNQEHEFVEVVRPSAVRVREERVRYKTTGQEERAERL